MDSTATSDRREDEARSASEPVVTARRRLVQGVFAAPAVLALHSGTAFANASSFNCAIKQVDDPVHPEDLPSPSDTYVRIQLWSLKPNCQSNSVKGWYIKGADLDAIAYGHAGVTNTFLNTGEWLPFDPVNNVVGNKVIGDPSWNGAPACMTKDGVWVAVRFDASFMDVRIIGVVGSGEGGSAISGSCWSSFAGVTG